MWKITLIAIISVILATSADAFVKKPGTKASLPVDQIYTPYGKSYLRRYGSRIIFPGTKWCGDGDIAENYDDLGYFKQTDSCCRDHDYCDDIILAGESNHGLTNNGSFTRLHCKCDHMFFYCLSAADCNCAGIVATTYFNILGAQCYDYLPPATCIEWDDIIGMRKRCVKYDYDESKPMEWQWFDLPRYIFGPEDNDKI